MLFKIIYIMVLILILVPISLQAQDLKEEIKNGDLKKIEELILKNRSLVNSKDKRGMTPLHHAAYFNRVKIAELLIGHKADLNAKDTQGKTPLLRATATGRKELVKLLIRKGADVNLQTNYQRSPLHFAASRGHKEIVKELIKGGADFEIKDYRGNTPLFLALYNNRGEVVVEFVNGDADVTARNKYGMTPVQLSVEYGYFEIVKLMLTKKNALTVTNTNSGRNLLHIAAINGHLDITNLLIKNGLNISAVDGNGRNPLYYAAKFGNRKIAELLQDNGAKSKNLVENYGFNALLEKELQKKEAYIWYTGACGWAVKTKNHLLIFDYWKYGKNPVEPLLANGHINPREIKNLDLYVFATHGDGDHFDKVIFSWKKEIKKVHYILGWKVKDAPEHIYLEGRNNKTIGKISISGINKKGSHCSAYIIKVDGLTILHQGDGSKKPDIDYAATIYKELDIAFLSAFEDRAYAIGKLHPRIVLPMHQGVYENADFMKNAKLKYPKLKINYAKSRGDIFFFSKGELRRN